MDILSKDKIKVTWSEYRGGQLGKKLIQGTVPSVHL